jgi:hypothetical protein
MSIKTIFESIESDFSKLFSKAPTVLQVVSTDIAVVAPVVETIITLTGNEAGAAGVALVVNQVEVDLTTALTVIKTSGSTASVKSVLQAVVSNLPAILSAGDIKDAATLAKVEAAVNLVVSELNVVIAKL